MDTLDAGNRSPACKRGVAWRATSRGAGQSHAVLLAHLRESDRAVRALLAEVRALLRHTQQVEQLAYTDPLTGLRNRRGLDEALERAEARARRYGTPAAVALLDVDGLKAVNDRHGHAAGDALLQEVAAALVEGARTADVVARVGGDEFAVLLLGTSTAGATLFLERVRRLAPRVVLGDDTAVPVGFTAGVAGREEAGSLTAALTLADERLRHAKGQALR